MAACSRHWKMYFSLALAPCSCSLDFCVSIIILWGSSGAPWLSGWAVPPARCSLVLPLPGPALPLRPAFFSMPFLSSGQSPLCPFPSFSLGSQSKAVFPEPCTHPVCLVLPPFSLSCLPASPHNLSRLPLLAILQLPIHSFLFS